MQTIHDPIPTSFGDAARAAGYGTVKLAAGVVLANRPSLGIEDNAPIALVIGGMDLVTYHRFGGLVLRGLYAGIANRRRAAAINAALGATPYRVVYRNHAWFVTDERGGAPSDFIDGIVTYQHPTLGWCQRASLLDVYDHLYGTRSSEGR
jgi:hypothetical protein